MQYQRRLGGETQCQRIRVQFYRFLTYKAVCHVMLLLPVAIFVFARCLFQLKLRISFTWEFPILSASQLREFASKFNKTA